MLRNHDLNLLPVFDALMREQHLSRAAERLNMSQSAVSNALKRLRLGLEDDLFVRTWRGLKPTERAIDLHQRIAPALQEIRDSIEIRDFDPSTFSRTVSISMISAAEYLWADILLPTLRESAPNARFKIQTDYIEDIPAQLTDGHLTYALDYKPLPDDKFGSHVLMREELALICAPDHPNVETGITMEDFERLPQASLVRRSEWMHARSGRRTTPLEYLMGDALPNRNVVVQMSSFLPMPSVVAKSDLIAVVPLRFARPLLDAGTLCRLGLPFDCPDVEMRLLWHKSRDSDPSHTWLLNQIIEQSAKVFA